MKKIIMGLFAIMFVGIFAETQEKKMSVGIAVATSTKLYKMEETPIYPFLLLDLEYEGFYIEKTAVVGYNVFNTDAFTASLFLDPLAGFAVNSTVSNGDMEDGYSNIDSRSFDPMIGGKLEMPVGVEGSKVIVSIQGGEEGQEGKVEMMKPYRITERLTLATRVHFTYYTSDFTDYYFGVTDNEVRRSLNDKLSKVYEPDSSFSLGGNIAANYDLNESLTLLMFVGIDSFSKDVSDSPIVENSVIFTAGAGVKYWF